MNLLDEIKESFKQGSTLTKLIYINLAVFLIVNIFNIFILLLQIKTFSVVEVLAVPANLNDLMFKPWTIITYMFLHEGFLHILFNMLVLFWFGKLFLSYLSQKQLLSVYLLGGIFGAAMFIFFYNIFPAFYIYKQNAIALGASASVMAVVVAISFYIPNNVMHLMFIGPVKLKYIAIAYIILDVISISGENGQIGGNAGGHIAHLGGVLFGYLYIVQFKKGRNIAKSFDSFADKIFTIFSRKTKMKVSYRNTNPSTYSHSKDMDYNAQKIASQEEINIILEKISKSGYDSLSAKEKEKLFKASSNYK
jgi:membrane associated rhomboid family serine protease